MSVKVKYKGNEIANLTETSDKTLKTSGKYCEGDILIENTKDGGITPTGSIEITENGTYDVTDKAEAVVEVQGGGKKYNSLDEFCSGTAKIIKIKNPEAQAFPVLLGYNIVSPTNLRYFSMPYVNKHQGGTLYEAFRARQNLNFCCLGYVGTLGNRTWLTSKLKTLVFNSDVVNPANQTGIFNSATITGEYPYTIYVPTSEGVNNYQTATNWSSIAEKFKSYSQAPFYDSETEYQIGDVCQYNGKFYAYCTETLEASTGNAPSGTNADTDYWDYIDEVTE